MSYHNHKEFVCPECGKDFSKARQLKAHLSDAHGKNVKKAEIQTKLRNNKR
jgi:uncharacterized Zn ribbon protein